MTDAGDQCFLALEQLMGRRFIAIIERKKVDWANFIATIKPAQ